MVITPQSQYLSDKAVAARYEVSRATVWRWNKESNLPKPVKFNGSTRWKLSDLEAWEQQKSGSAM
jgi:predicted DNA-binding transcriptional regulator AlpA